MAAGIGLRGLLDVPVVEFVVDRAELIPTAGGIVAAISMGLRATTRMSLSVPRLRRARTLVLGCLLEAIIERVIQHLALVMSCAGRRLLFASAAGIEPHELFGGSAVELVIDRAEIILDICRVARARSDFVLHATIATGERILSIPVAVPVARGERILNVSVAAVPVARGLLGERKRYIREVE